MQIKKLKHEINNVSEMVTESLQIRKFVIVNRMVQEEIVIKNLITNKEHVKAWLLEATKTFLIMGFPLILIALLLKWLEGKF